MVQRIAVVGAGWSGLAAALECSARGAKVTLFEMAPAIGGRARDLNTGDDGLDNGQHICIGAYSETLRLMARVGVAEEEAFLRLPLRLVDARGLGLRLPAGRAMPAFARAVLARRGWSWGERFALLRVAAGWARSGFVCPPDSTVDDLVGRLPEAVRRELIEPLCVAALNTPAKAASGTVFLRVLHDALAAGAGASDLLLPRVGLSALFPQPALARLTAAGTEVRLAHRVERVERNESAEGCWRIDGDAFDAVVVAASAVEAARLLAPHDPAWAERAAALRYEPIVTVYARSEGAHLPEPMLVLHADDAHPAQFVFDRGRLGGPAGLLAFVISGAEAWVARGLVATEAATLEQARSALAAHLRAPVVALRTIVEKRATFRCTPRLARPPLQVAPGLVAAGDYIDGPYPATLEGALRSGTAAARALLSA
ncbi:MAG: hydroxysqualene dehydroxylase HpnE [Burkholderiales bacterium]|nr:hydroxysqualene dehydroxylase HpnE [Burkholderiales bacterium]